MDTMKMLDMIEAVFKPSPELEEFYARLAAALEQERIEEAERERKESIPA
jgi:hypothetical protein